MDEFPINQLSEHETNSTEAGVHEAFSILKNIVVKLQRTWNNDASQTTGSSFSTTAQLFGHISL